MLLLQEHNIEHNIEQRTHSIKFKQGYSLETENQHQQQSINHITYARVQIKPSNIYAHTLNTPKPVGSRSPCSCSQKAVDNCYPFVQWNPHFRPNSAQHSYT